MTYKIVDLQAKAAIIRDYFGGRDELEKKLKVSGFSQKQPWKTFETYLKGGQIRRDNAEKLASAIGIELSVLEAPLSQFIQELYQFKAEKVFDLLGFVKNVANTGDSLRGYYEEYKGFYFCWINWIEPPDQNKEGVAKRAIYKLIIKIDGIDVAQKIILASMTTKRHYSRKKPDTEYRWGWKGILIPIQKNGTMFFILENIDRYTTKIGYAIISVIEGNPERGLNGIFLAEPSIVNDKNHYPPPSSTRIFMKKIEGCNEENVETYLKQMDFINWDDIEEFDKDKLINELDEFKLLSAKKG